MLISLIICTYKRPELLKTCLACATEVIKSINGEIIIINDCIEDKVDVIEDHKIHLFNNTSHGLASARNLGAKKAKGDLILFIDDDIEFTVENVKNLLELSLKKPNACFNPNWKYSDEMNKIVRKTQFGRFLINVDLVNYKGWVRELPWQENIFRVNKLAGFFMLIPKKIFDLTTGFNTQFINQGTEDDEFCKRLIELNAELYVDPSNYVFHNELDRIGLEQRLSRYINGSINRRKAFEMGHKEYEIVYSKNKKMILKIISNFKNPLIFFTKIIPNIEFFDKLYYSITHILIAIAIYEGYTSTEESF